MALVTRYSIQDEVGRFLTAEGFFSSYDDDAVEFWDEDEAIEELAAYPGCTVETYRKVDMTARICSIEGCEKPHTARGWCNTHYQSFRRCGQPIAPGAANGALLKFVEDVALGYQGDECLDWPFPKVKGGYGQLDVGEKKMRAHRYICIRVHGNPPEPKYDCAHNCGNRACVNPRHLRWATHVENMADQLIHGTRSRGERHGHSKLTETDVRQILSLKGVVASRQLSDRFGVTASTIARIHRGEIWGWLSNHPDFTTTPSIEKEAA